MIRQPRYAFDLFVAGMGPRAQRALAVVRETLQDHAPGDYALRVVDVLEDPAEAERAGIVATPTLVRVLPLPQHRIVGDVTRAEARDLLEDAGWARGAEG